MVLTCNIWRLYGNTCQAELPLQLTDTSSLCVQSCLPIGLAGQSVRRASVPSHLMLSNQIWPFPGSNAARVLKFKAPRSYPNCLHTMWADEEKSHYHIQFPIRHCGLPQDGPRWNSFRLQDGYLRIMKHIVKTEIPKHWVLKEWITVW